jgi:hypothetical protein
MAFSSRWTKVLSFLACGSLVIYVYNLFVLQISGRLFCIGVWYVVWKQVFGCITFYREFHNSCMFISVSKKRNSKIGALQTKIAESWAQYNIMFPGSKRLAQPLVEFRNQVIFKRVGDWVEHSIVSTLGFKVVLEITWNLNS